MLLALSWLFVGVPLLWGVSQTFIKALTLFK
ncbi:MFS transporter small subunit [Hymenobacter humi]